jgi:hypothetical protein
MHINVYYVTNLMLQILDSVHRQIFKVHTSDAESASSSFCSFSEMAGHLKPVLTKTTSTAQVSLNYLFLLTYGF